MFALVGFCTNGRSPLY